MYILMYDNNPVKIDPPKQTDMATFTTPEAAWREAESRAILYGLNVDKYEVAKLTPLLKVTRTVVAFVESE